MTEEEAAKPKTKAEVIKEALRLARNGVEDASPVQWEATAFRITNLASELAQVASELYALGFNDAGDNIVEAVACYAYLRKIALAQRDAATDARP